MTTRRFQTRRWFFGQRRIVSEDAVKVVERGAADIRYIALPRHIVCSRVDCPSSLLVQAEELS